MVANASVQNLLDELNSYVDNPPLRGSAGQQRFNALIEEFAQMSIKTKTAVRPVQPGLREAVGVFHQVKDLQAAIDDLLSSGFDRAELSLLASEHAVEAKLGGISFRNRDLEDDVSIPRGVYVSPEAVSAAEGGLVGGLAYVGGVATAGIVALAGGPLSAIILAAVLAGAAGGLLGTGLAEVVGHRRAAYFQEQLDRGGLLLWVRTWDKAHEQRAVEILARHAGGDVHVHSVPERPTASPRVEIK
jgi:outer membrane lipoprotein SlyB